MVLDAKLLIAALVALFGMLVAIARHWHVLESRRLDACEKGREDLQQKQVELTGRVERLTGHMTAVENLSAAVLEHLQRHDRKITAIKDTLESSAGATSPTDAKPISP